MNPRTTGILLLLTAALGAFVYFYEIGGEEQRAEAEATGKRLFPDVEVEAISSIRLTTSDGVSARLEHAEGSWTLSEPLAFPADVFTADGLASNLAGLSSEALLEDPQPLEEYGLGDAARVVRFSADGTEHGLRLGKKTPIGSNSYAQVEGSPAIMTVATYKARSFEKSLTDLRERRILDFDTNAVQRIEVSWPDGSVHLERVLPATPEDDAEDADTAEGAVPSTWRLTAPVEGRADDEAVDRLLSDLSFLRADGFVDDPSDEALAGFDDPAYEIVLHGEAGEDGTQRIWRFTIGPVHDGDKLLARGAETSLYTISAARLIDFPRQVIAYRFKRLADFRVSDAFQLDFFFQPSAGDPVALTAERTADGWTSSPEKLLGGKVARIVSELSRLEAGDVRLDRATEEELAELGLAPPNSILSVYGEAPEPGDATDPEAALESLPRLAEIHIGNVEGSEWILARAVGDPTVYRLSYDLAEHVPVSLEAFRNRFLAEAHAEEPAPVAADEVLEEFLSPSEESP
jgi:hypothetical protein